MNTEFKVPALTAAGRRTPSTNRTKAFIQSDEQPTHLQVGDQVNALSYSGVLRFLGTIGDKQGIFGGIELTGPHRGKGKNDGCVQDVRYFECAPECGIFVPASKIIPALAMPSTPLSASLSASTNTQSSYLPRPPSTTPRKALPSKKSSAETAQDLEARITQGSRASKYLHMTAAQLATRTPRKSNLASSTATIRATSPSKVSTPGAKGRQSFGMGMPVTPATGPRRSLGTSTAASVPKSIRRPSSRNAALASSTATLSGSVSPQAVPDVPPLPANYVGTPSLAASQAVPSGRRTPSGRQTPSALPTPGMRRYSAVDSRPATPARSVSRQSNASEMGESRSQRRQSAIGRPSSRASILDSSASSVFESNHSRELELLQAEKVAAQRSADEARLAQNESERALKASHARFEELRLRLDSSEQQLRSAQYEAKQGVVAGDEASKVGIASAARVAEFEQKIDEQRNEMDALRQTTASTRQTERQAHIAALEAAEQKMKEIEGSGANVRAELEGKIAELKDGGFQLIQTYNAQLHEAETAKLQLQQALHDANSELAALQKRLQAGPAQEEDNATASRAQTVLSIDNETLRAETQHMRTRIHSLEEQLAESQNILDSEVEKANQKRLDSTEAEGNLQKEIRKLKESLERAHKAETKLNSHSNDLQKALTESKLTLERERAELESLRANGTVIGQVQEHSELQVQLDAALEEARQLRDHNSVLAEEVKLHEEIRAGHLAEETELNKLASDNKAIRQLLLTKDAELTALQNETASLRPERAPTDTDRPGVTSAAAKSPSTKPATGSYADDTYMKEQLVGLKLIVNQLTEENRDYRQQNQRLIAETEALRMAQRELEQTVNTLIEDAEDNDEQPSPTLRRSKSSSVPPPATDAALQQAKQRLIDLERRKNEEIQSLNAEVAELENLIEAKIFKQDELESKLRQSAAQLAQAKAQGFALERQPSTASTASSATEVCELCELPGHDIETCPVMAGNLDSMPLKRPSESKVCQICDGLGHESRDCPTANDVF